MTPHVIPSDIANEYGLDVLGYDLNDAISCLVTEERNGLYDLELRYPVGGVNADKLVPEAIIATIINDDREEDYFRISSVSGTSADLITVYASHISYELAGRYKYGVTINESSGEAFLNAVLSGLGSIGYTGHSDIIATIKYENAAPESVRSLLLNEDKTHVLAYTNGEYKFRKKDIYLYANRGSEKSMILGDGDDLISLEVSLSSDELYTHVMPYVRYSNDGRDVYVYGTRTSLNSSMATTKVYPLDLSDEFEPLDADNVPTTAQINTHASVWISNNGARLTTLVPAHNASLTPLWYGSGYAQTKATRLELCDTVTVEYKPLNVKYTGKIVKTVYDAIEERYTSMSIGEEEVDFIQSYARQENATRQYPEEWHKDLTSAITPKKVSMKDGTNTTELVTNELSIETSSMETTLGSGLKQTNKSSGMYTQLGYSQLTFNDGNRSTSMKAFTVNHSSGTAEATYTFSMPNGMYLVLHGQPTSANASAVGAQLIVVGTTDASTPVVLTLTGSGSELTATTGTRSQIVMGKSNGTSAGMTWTVSGRSYRRLYMIRLN